MNKFMYLKIYAIVFLLSIVVSLMILIPFYVNDISSIYNQLQPEMRESTLAGAALKYAPFTWVFGKVIYFSVLIQPVFLVFYIFFLVHSIWILRLEWNNFRLITRSSFICIMIVFLVVQGLQILNWKIIGLWLVD